MQQRTEHRKPRFGGAFSFQRRGGIIPRVRSRPPAIDTGMLVARIARLSGHRGPALAELVGLPAGRVNSLADGRPAKPDEERRLLAALRAAGGTMDGLTR